MTTPQDANTLLFTAIKDGNIKAVDAALRKGAKVNTPDVTGDTPLHEAVRCGSTDIARVLLDAGAKADAKRKRDSVTALHQAAQHGYPDMVRLLIDSGASVDARDSAGYTALIWAARKGYTEMARLLIERGAEVNAIDAWQSTPLHLAVIESKNPEMVRLLIEQGAEPTLENDAGKTALDYAREYANKGEDYRAIIALLEKAAHQQQERTR